MSEHYFAPQPSSTDDRHQISVTLAGRVVQVWTASGVFSGERLDPGTEVLLRGATPPATGTFLDLGCGWGPISLDLAMRAPTAKVIAVDINERARDLTAANAAELGLANVRVLDPETALADLMPGSVDLLWSNPPIRIGKDALHELLATWLPRLSPNGRADLVVSKNLGADSLQRWIVAELGMSCERTGSSKGFRILTVRPS